MLYPPHSPQIQSYSTKISFLYNFTKFFTSCLLSFTIIFRPVVKEITVSGVSCTNSIKSGFINTFWSFSFVTSITFTPLFSYTDSLFSETITRRNSCKKQESRLSSYLCILRFQMNQFLIRLTFQINQFL